MSCWLIATLFFHEPLQRYKSTNAWPTVPQQWLARYGVDANYVAGLIPFSGQMIRHFAYHIFIQTINKWLGKKYEF